MAITDWPEQERPREKLLRAGAASLSDAELLAIFLRVGMAGKTAVDLARDLLQHFQSLNGVFSADVKQMTAVPGMGVSKYCQLQAVLEMSKRALALNAAALILSHNHPGGSAVPSRADEQLTISLKDALNLVDIKVLDHIIVARQDTFSFSERGLI